MNPLSPGRNSRRGSCIPHRFIHWSCHASQNATPHRQNGPDSPTDSAEDPNFLEPTSQTKSEFVFGYQLDGEWVMDHHGLPSSLPVDRVRTVLDTIQRTNVALSKSGAVNYANPDGSVANPGGYGAYSYFPPELMMLGMNYMYEGQVPFGTELVRKMWYNIVCLQGYTWDVPNIMRGDVDTGERVFGNDYYQDLMLWSLPAAIAGQDFAAPTKPGGLVDRILTAARADQ